MNTQIFNSSKISVFTTFKVCKQNKTILEIDKIVFEEIFKETTKKNLRKTYCSLRGFLVFFFEFFLRGFFVLSFGWVEKPSSNEKEGGHDIKKSDLGKPFTIFPLRTNFETLHIK